MGKRRDLRAGDFTHFYRKRYENHQLGTGYFVCNRIITATKTVEFVSYRNLYNSEKSLVYYHYFECACTK